MRVLVIGASGAIGVRLVPRLRERGHEVIGTARSPGKAGQLRALGAGPVALDLLDARAARQVVLDARPEDDPLDPAPPKTARQGSAAMRHLDEAVTAAGGIALRYGGFYGAANDGLLGPVRKRQFPIVGSGAGVSSFVHLEDAATATVLAVEHDGPAIYNIV